MQKCLREKLTLCVKESLCKIEPSYKIAAKQKFFCAYLTNSYPFFKESNTSKYIYHFLLVLFETLVIIVNDSYVNYNVRFFNVALFTNF